jgi:hypothetical protein
MKQVDYVRMAEKCARDADRMPPGPERDELLKKLSYLSPTRKWTTGLRRRACSRQTKTGYSIVEIRFAQALPPGEAGPHGV